MDVWRGGKGLRPQRRIISIPTCYVCDACAMQFDLKSKKSFLKPTEYPSIGLDDLFIGARVNM